MGLVFKNQETGDEADRNLTNKGGLWERITFVRFFTAVAVIKSLEGWRSHQLIPTIYGRIQIVDLDGPLRLKVKYRSGLAVTLPNGVFTYVENHFLSIAQGE